MDFFINISRKFLAKENGCQIVDASLKRFNIFRGKKNYLQIILRLANNSSKRIIKRQSFLCIRVSLALMRFLTFMTTIFIFLFYLLSKNELNSCREGFPVRLNGRNNKYIR